MKNLFKLSILLLFTLVFIQCVNSGKFEIAKGKVGKLTPETTILELNSIFKNDSIVSILSEGVKGDDYFQDDDEFKIYEKGGKHLLTIVPKEQLDSSSTIKSIEIFDSRFKTASGINLNSTFEQVNANTKIDKVESSFSSATLFIDELNATMAIDKQQLGLKEFSTQKVSLAQIPDLARMKSFVIWFN